MDRHTGHVRFTLGCFAFVAVCFCLAGCSGTNRSLNIFSKHNGKRLPKASTCVGFGDMRAESAKSAKSELERKLIQDQARRAYQQAIKIDPNYAKAYLGLARLYQDMKDYDRAEETYRTATAKFPDNGDLWLDYGICFARQHKWQDAIACMRKALETDSENPTYINTLGFTMLRAGQYEEGYEYFKRTVGEAKAHYHVARMLFHVNKPELGTQHLRLAVLSDPQFEPARELLARIESTSQTPNAAQPKESDRPKNNMVTVSFEELDDVEIEEP
ncbi:MAG: hypothetical protein KatS3mg105_4247 [Gemmatales bacterium]|nr:MAG: hypothetical protein KatS3mg105_4247 [Gemmatales bacterium]